MSLSRVKFFIDLYSDVIPELAERLAAEYAAGHDLEASKTRFMIWFDTNTGGSSDDSRSSDSPEG